jgi:hypothetical protein
MSGVPSLSMVFHEGADPDSTEDPMEPEAPIREHHLTAVELREFFSQRRLERDLREASPERGGAVAAFPVANED